MKCRSLKSASGQMENLVRALKNHEVSESLVRTFEYKEFTVF